MHLTILLSTFLLAAAAPSQSIYHDGWTDLNKNGRMDVYEDPSAPVDARVEDLLSQMTLDEKTCQMVTLYGYQRVLRDDLPKEYWKTSLWKDGVGAIDEHLNGFKNWGAHTTGSDYIWPASRHAWALNEVQRFFIEQTRLGIPVDFTNEGIRGIEAWKATDFPTQLGMGHTWDRELIRNMGRITGREARLLGYTNVYAPILDVGRDQRWGRYEEVYGESPFLVGELGVEMALGLQTDMQVASTAKHFLGYSNNKGAREGMARVDPQMSPHEMENIHVYPWVQVIRRGGILGAMVSYNDYDGEPVESSHYWLYDRLRGEWGFRGYLVSDSDAVEYLHTKHRVTANMKESAAASVNAGLNVRCTFRSPDSYVLPLRQAVQEGLVSMETIDERVRDILRVKFLVGMFDRPYQTDYEAADREVCSRENNEYALRASRESLVLLKNDGTLPFSKDCKVAVVGPNADEVSFAMTHYGPLTTESVSVLKGLQTIMRESVTYAKGCEMVDEGWPDTEIVPTDPTEKELAMIAEAVRAASESDVVVAVMGGGQRTCGENKSRTSLDLPGKQNLLLKELHKTGKPVVLVLINGRPLSVNWADRNLSAIIEAWYPGANGGTAIAEALTGDYNPGGKLTVTFPKTVGQIPFNFPFKPNSQVDGNRKPGPDGNQSRVNGALYDFGYGLSYTTFKYSDLTLSSHVIGQDDSVKVSFKITNTGNRRGDEIPQLYIHDCISSITVYERQLRGFDRIALEPGETKTVTFTLTPDHLSLLDKDFRRVVEPGVFDILIGASSTDIRLQKKLRVSDGTPEGSSDPNIVTGLPKVEFPVKASKGTELAFPIKEGKEISYLNVTWGKDTDCRFEIQYTNGGGQFFTAFKGKATSASGKACYKFNPAAASELKLVITSGKATVRGVDCWEIQK